MRRLLLAVALLFAGFAAPAQAKEIWSTSGDRVTFTPARISFPARPGGLAIAETKEFSHIGEGLDAVVRYQTADETVFATAYVYLPGLAHSGLAAAATDEAIRINSESPVTRLGSAVVAAAGKPNAAVRLDYSGYRGNLVSSAAFIKADRWIVKLRVSGPEPRKAEVTASMAALLDGMSFEGESRPWPANPIETPPCSDRAVADAHPLSESDSETMEYALLYGALDPVGTRPGEKPDKAIASRVGDHWCRLILDAGAAKVPVLRATDAGGGAVQNSALFVLYSDAGGTLEVVRAKPDRYLLIHHAIGSTTILGTYDAVPSPRQLADILVGKADGGGVRARIVLKANGNSDIQIQVPSKPAAAPKT